MEAKLVKELMEAYASVYAQSEEVIAESDCECEDEEKSEKETSEMNGKKKGKKEEDKEEKEEVTEAKRIAHGTGKKVMPSAKERSALAKKARAGKDIGKPGKGFEKIAAKAAKQYGSEEAGKRVAAAAMFKAQAKEEVETDLFDVILEYLVSEGYADSNQAAFAIMANMSEDWKQSIVEAPGEWFGGLRDRARASRAAQMQSSQPTSKPLPSSSSPFAKPASRNDSGKLTTYGAGGGAAAERAGQTRTQVMQQGAKNLENKKSKPVNQGPDFGR